MGNPRIQPLPPINENSPSVTSPIKRLAYGSIISGLLITSNITLPKTQIITIPTHLKLAALAVTIAGLLVALELANLTSKQFRPAPKIATHHFSNILGFFPTIIHRLPPKINLSLGQYIASQILDQT